MAPATRITCLLALALTGSGVTLADPQHEHEQHGNGRTEARGEPHPGPRGYERPVEPHGWNSRPATVDRHDYEHNYQASRVYHIGVYRRPHGWVAHRWAYGEILPRVYWAAPYIIADYWLFGLEVAPAGYEWVRNDTDAILVNVATGQILQVEYGVFG